MFFFFVPKTEHRILPTERPILKARDHWVVLVPALLEACGELLVLMFLSWLFPQDPQMWLIQSLLWYGMWVAVIRLAWRMMHWWDKVLAVTDERFMCTYGVINSTTDAMPVKKLTDITFRRSFPGLIFGYGAIRIESAGHDSLRYFRYIPFPEVVFEAISKLVFSKNLPEPRRKGRRKHRWRRVTQEELSAQWPAKVD